MDGIEVNDSISICGGEFNINSQKDAFHCENSDDDTSGSVFIENGVQVDSIPQSMMGGKGGGHKGKMFW